MTDKQARSTVKQMFGRPGSARAFKQGPQTRYEIGLKFDGNFVAVGAGMSWGVAFATLDTRLRKAMDEAEASYFRFKGEHRHAAAGICAHEWHYLNRLGDFNDTCPFHTAITASAPEPQPEPIPAEAQA
jgi:hypothetical protein